LIHFAYHLYMVLDSRGEGKEYVLCGGAKKCIKWQILPVDYFLLESREKAAEDGSLLL